jgi:hypothetical protein
MLFTAVTLGFFAENVREHMSEKEKKKELMNIVSLDLQRDLNQLEFHKLDATSKMGTCDSLYPVIEMDPKKINLKLYYRLLCNHLAYWDFNSNDKSRDEADAKGYFRDAESAELAYNISKYNFFLLDYKTVEAETVRLRTKLKDQMVGLTEVKYFNSVLSLNGNAGLPDTIGVKPIDPIAKERVEFIVATFRNCYSGYLVDIDSLNVYGKKAIELINARYN